MVWCGLVFGLVLSSMALSHVDGARQTYLKHALDTDLKTWSPFDDPADAQYGLEAHATAASEPATPSGGWTLKKSWLGPWGRRGPHLRGSQEADPRRGTAADLPERNAH